MRRLFAIDYGYKNLSVIELLYPKLQRGVLFSKRGCTFNDFISQINSAEISREKDIIIMDGSTPAMLEALRNEGYNVVPLNVSI